MQVTKFKKHFLEPSNQLQFSTKKKTTAQFWNIRRNIGFGSAAVKQTQNKVKVNYKVALCHFFLWIETITKERQIWVSMDSTT